MTTDHDWLKNLRDEQIAERLAPLVDLVREDSVLGPPAWFWKVSRDPEYSVLGQVEFVWR